MSGFLCQETCCLRGNYCPVKRTSLKPVEIHKRRIGPIVITMRNPLISGSPDLCKAKSDCLLTEYEA